MEQKNTPIEIARLTLMQLTQRKIQPTPDNFRTVYDEIAGFKSVDQSLEVVRSLEKVLYEAGKKNPKFIVVAQAITSIKDKKDWTKLEDQLRKLFPSSNNEEDSSEVNWSVLIRTLIKQLEVSHKGVTLSRKKEGLSRVLNNFASDSDLLGQKIQALITSWGDSSTALEVPSRTISDLSVQDPLQINQSGSHPSSSHSSIDLTAQNKMLALWRDMLLKSFELVLIPHLEFVPEKQSKAQALLEKMRKEHKEPLLYQHAQDLKIVLLNIEMERDNQRRIHQSLLGLLNLMIRSMGELVVEDKWLYGQTAMIKDVLTKPLNLDTLYDAENSLKDLIYKQSHIKPALIEAKDTLKKMATTFVDRLVELTESTTDYHSRIEGYQTKISSTEEIGELNIILKNILEDTKSIGLNVQRTRDEFKVIQKKAEAAEKRTQELSAELDHISEIAHEDYLTGTLNRRGMDEALEREFSRADRFNTCLSVALMDIDHFKKLNDALGHATGDEALVHLCKVIKEVMRTTDVLARYGGEEFLIILPGTPQQEAINVVTRIQRELTKNFFLHQNERVLITFSAGVAERVSGENPEILIPRADAALYQAKNSGRNRVVGSETVLNLQE